MEILKFHDQVFGEEHQEWCERALNFMVYELNSRVVAQPDARKSDILDDFFFRTKKFAVVPMHLPPRQGLSEKKGHSLFITQVYCHLAVSLGLKAQVLNWPLHHYVRRSCEERTVYVDLDQNGKILSEDEVLTMLSGTQQEVKLLSPQDAAICYLQSICTALKQIENHEPLHRAYSLLLGIEPENTKWLGERAILRRKIGLSKEAMQDLKRYFAFVERHSATKELLDIYEELQTHSTT